MARKRKSPPSGMDMDWTPPWEKKPPTLKEVQKQKHPTKLVDRRGRHMIKPSVPIPPKKWWESDA